MAYAGPEFAYDVFISYSQGLKPRDGTSDLLEWSTEFQQLFVKRLNEQIGREVCDVFFDKDDRSPDRLSPHEPFPAKLELAATSAAAFVIMASHFWATSKWCKDELAWWRKAQTLRSLTEKDGLLLAKIWRNPDLERTWPAVLAEEHWRLGDYLGKPFYDEKQPPTLPYPYYFLRDRPEEKGLLGRLIAELAAETLTKLIHIRKKREAAQAAAQMPHQIKADEKPKLLLLGPPALADQLKDARARLSRSLFTVYPEDPQASAFDFSHELKRQSPAVIALKQCHAVAYLAPSDPGELSEDLFVIERSLIPLSLDEDGPRRKPQGLVLKSAGAPARPENSPVGRQFHWIDLAQPDWVTDARSSLTAPA